MTSDIGTTPTAGEMADRLAIQDILNAHCRGLDRLDEALLKTCYWPGAEVDYGSYKGPAQPFAELVVTALRGQYELTRHCLSNTLITLRGDLALAETYVNAAHLLPGAEQEMLFGGRYLDTLEKRDGRWKLRHRRVVIDWSRRHRVDDERAGAAFADLARGGHGAEDPLCVLLGQADQEDTADGR